MDDLTLKSLKRLEISEEWKAIKEKMNEKRKEFGETIWGIFYGNINEGNEKKFSDRNRGVLQYKMLEDLYNDVLGLSEAFSEAKVAIQSDIAKNQENIKEFVSFQTQGLMNAISDLMYTENDMIIYQADQLRLLQDYVSMLIRKNEKPTNGEVVEDPITKDVNDDAYSDVKDMEVSE